MPKQGKPTAKTTGQRRAEALRRNLQLRKAQARGRAASRGDAATTQGAPERPEGGKG